MAKYFEKKLAQVGGIPVAQPIPLGKSTITYTDAEALAAKWYNEIPQTQSEYTTAKDLLGYLTENRASKGLFVHPITAHSRFWALEDVKKNHSDKIDPDLFKQVIDILWERKHHS